MAELHGRNKIADFGDIARSEKLHILLSILHVTIGCLTVMLR
jgi:hypothetical protein